MPVVSNIHYNLVAWASGSFASGQRCSNASNAYQCVTSGTSTGAPTGTGSLINNGGSAVFKFLSSIDYTSLDAWSGAISTPLTQPVVGQLWNNGPITTTSGVAFLSALTGHVTSATNTITITPAPGESFADMLTTADPFTGDFPSSFGGGSGAAIPLAFSTNGVNFVLPATGVGGINYFNVQDDNVFLNGLQFQDPNATSGSTILLTNQNVTIENCIFDGYGQTGGASLIEGTLTGASTCVFKMLNCLVVDRSPNASSGVSLDSNYNSVFANNTIVAINAPASQSGIVCSATSAGITAKLINTIMCGYAPANAIYALSTAAIAVSFCVFTSTILTGAGITLGSGNLYSKVAANQFNDPTLDFRLKIGSDALNVGFTDTTDIPFSTDILGTSRPQGTSWDIGAYEFGVGSSSVGMAAGHSAAAGVTKSLVTTKGTATGSSAAHGVPNVGGISVGSASGHSTATGVARGPVSAIGSAVGSSTAFGVNASQALGAVIELDPISPQQINTPFNVTGDYTLTPVLQFSDDATGAFTPMPLTGISPIGTITFSFIHPGVPDIGSHNIIVEDQSTGNSTSENYLVNAGSVRSITDSAFPPKTPALLKILPSYLYEEYHDDVDLQCLVQGQNAVAQAYMDWFNNLNLPIYTGPTIVGPLLDWVGEGLYGIKRPNIALSTTSGDGPYNTYVLNFLPFNSGSGAVSSTVFTVTDDIYKRIITWSFYKGDGKIFTTTWLKRRIMRFLGGLNGTDYGVDQTNQVSVKFTSKLTVTITISSGTIPTTYGPILRAAIISGVLPLPFQYVYNVLLT